MAVVEPALTNYVFLKDRLRHDNFPVNVLKVFKIFWTADY